MNTCSNIHSTPQFVQFNTFAHIGVRCVALSFVTSTHRFIYSLLVNDIESKSRNLYNVRWKWQRKTNCEYILRIILCQHWTSTCFDITVSFGWHLSKLFIFTSFNLQNVRHHDRCEKQSFQCEAFIHTIRIVAITMLSFNC